MKGIDVSVHNGFIDWHAVKNAGIDFAICRTGYGKSGIDDSFQRNVNAAHEAGCLLELPVFFDLEDGDGYKQRHGFVYSKRHVTNICRAWLEAIKPLNSGIYTGLYWLRDWVDWQSLGCPIWNAQWNKTDDFKGYMWQFTDALCIDGKIFDGNILYDETDSAQ